MKLGYLGPAGTYSEEAAYNYSPDAEMVSYPSIPTVIAAVEKREIDQCVVPIENSLHGAITDVLDFLVRKHRTLPFDKMVSHQFPLAEINDAFQRAEWDQRQTEITRAVLVP